MFIVMLMDGWVDEWVGGWVDEWVGWRIDGWVVWLVDELVGWAGCLGWWMDRFFLALNF